MTPMTEIWQVATRDTPPEWFDLKADALARVDALVDAGKVPVCVVVPLWGDQEREGTRRGCVRTLLGPLRASQTPQTRCLGMGTTREWG